MSPVSCEADNRDMIVNLFYLFEKEGANGSSKFICREQFPSETFLTCPP